MSPSPSLNVFVYTGDRKYSGTNNTIHLILHGKDGHASKPVILNHFFTDEFERGQIDSFKIAEENVTELDRFVELDMVEVWKDKTLGLISDDWFVDKIVVENCANHKSYSFPFYRWIKCGQRYFIQHLDTSLPQFDPHRDQRDKELEEKRIVYEYAQKIPNGPVQIKALPEDENFSFDYKWNLNKTKLGLAVKGKLSLFKLDDFKTMEDITDIYDDHVFVKPKSADKWKCDMAFGRKRMNSINPSLIRRFTAVPEKFPVTDSLLGPLLEGDSIQQAIDLKKLYWVDLAILDGIPSKPGYVLCKPMLLLMVDSEKNLRPIAIQLFQEPGPENPIFTPLDDPTLWTFVKMWYDNSDCSYHQALTHLGLTHLLMEGVAIAANRNLSPSHPIFKVLAPHFLYVIAINSLALGSLVSPGGWVDKTMGYGAEGLLALAAKGFEFWRMEVDGLIPAELKEREIDDREALPNFYWRDDSLLLFNAIKKYISSYVDLYYTSQDMLQEDSEVQAWAEELARERSTSGGGVGIKGVPGNGVLTCKSQLVDILTSVIYVCSCGHASANFGQYEEYAYPPNYPTMIRTPPPTCKDVKLTEKEILESLPHEEMIQDILIVTTILSRKGTNSLGDFEVEYIFDPRAQDLVAEFRHDLDNISKQIKARNQTIEFPYDDLLPESIPNSISI